MAGRHHLEDATTRGQSRGLVSERESEKEREKKKG